MTYDISFPNLPPEPLDIIGKYLNGYTQHGDELVPALHSPDDPTPPFAPAQLLTQMFRPAHVPARIQLHHPRSRASPLRAP